MTTPLLDGMRVIVTGAGTGLGAAYAEAAAAQGAAVVINDVDDGLLAATADRIRARGGRVEAVRADVGDWDQSAEIVATCVRAFGGVDALVNNAGIVGRVRPIWEEQPDARRTIDVNVVGLLFVAAHASREMVRAGNGGTIVNVTSGAQMGMERQGTYCASKGAVASYTYSWARDLEPHGVRVNAISPNAPGNQLDQIIEQLGYNPEEHHASLPTKEDNAAVVVYLLSALSQHLNGQVVRVSDHSLSLLSHPLIMEPAVDVAEFTVESVTAAFTSTLDAQLQPAGIAAGTITSARLLL